MKHATLIAVMIAMLCTPAMAAVQTKEVDYTFINYPGAVHSFTNPDADTFGREFNLPLAYNQEADEKSWQTMRIFFIDIFKK